MKERREKKTKIWKPTDAWVTIKTVETTKVVVVVAAAFFSTGLFFFSLYVSPLSSGQQTSCFV